MQALEFNDPRVQKHKRRLKSIRLGSMKYILASPGEEELYDLKMDPSEAHNLNGTAAYGPAKTLLHDALKKVIAAHGEPFKSTPLDKDTEEALKSLGYIQ